MACDAALAAARAALAPAADGPRAWLVGGAVRDRLLARPTTDFDLVVDGDVAAAARALGRSARAAAFPLSEAHGAWRVVHRDWQADLTPLRGGSLEADLALRDFTVNAMAEPLHASSEDRGELVDPLGGTADLRAGRLRACAPSAFADDPLRVVRLARFAVTLDLVAEPDTARAAAAQAPALQRVAGERVFAELKRMLTPRGIELLADTGALEQVLPEVATLRGVQQTVYHHRDAYGHTLEVLERALDPPALLGPEHAATVAELMAEPLADELTRGDALRWAALLHDSAKPQTQTPNPKGGFGFPGHQTLGAETVRAVLTRLRTSERLRAHVAAMTRHHLDLGYLVHAERGPDGRLPARTVHAYLLACSPVAADVTLLTVCDRLATRGRKSDEAIARHLELAREVWPAVYAWDREGPPTPLLRGDELGLPPGPQVGALLADLAEAQYAGEVRTREEALARAAQLAAELASRRSAPSTTRTAS